MGSSQQESGIASARQARDRQATKPDERTQYDYDAFISYRTKDGRRITTWLSRQLRRYRPPRGFPRPLHSLRIYRDSERHRVTSRIWDSRIQPALSRSRFLIIILTPAVLEDAGGGTNWVLREFREFVRLRGEQNVLFVWGGGAAELPFPDAFRAVFPEPGWIDLRPALRASRLAWTRALLRERLTALAVPLLDIPDDEIPALSRLVQTEQRRIAWATATIAALLLTVMSGLAVTAWWQRRAARQQAEIAVSRQLAAQANLLLVQDSGQSRLTLLLALESQRRRASAEGDFAVRQALHRHRKRIKRWSASDKSPFPRLFAAAEGGQSLITADDRGLWEVGLAASREDRITELESIQSALLTERWGGLVTGTPGGIVRLRVGPERRVEARRHFGGAIVRLALSADESLMAVSTPLEVHVVTLPKLETLRTIRPSNDATPHAWFRADGRLMILDQYFNLSTYAPQSTRRESTSHLATAARLPFTQTVATVSRNGRLFVSGAETSTRNSWAVAVFDDGGREMRRFEFDAPLAEFAMSPDGRYLAIANMPVMVTATRGNTPWVRIFQLQDGIEVFQLAGDRVSGVVFTDDSRTLCFSVRIGIECAAVEPTLSWSTTDLKIPTSDSTTALTEISPDGGFVASTVMGNKNAFAIGRWQPLVPYASGSYVSFSPDGRWLVTLAGEGVKVIDMVSGTSSSPSSIRHPRFALLSEDARRILINRQEGTVILERATGVIVRDVPEVQGRTLSPSGLLLGYTSGQDELTVVRVDDGKELGRITVPEYAPIVRIDPSDRYLAVVDSNGTLFVHSLTDRDRPLLLQRNISGAAVAFAPDGRAVAVASSDGLARVFALPSGLELNRIQRGEPLSAVQFTRDGGHLWLGVRGQRLERHLLRVDDLSSLACQAVGDNLTTREWDDFVGGTWEPTCRQ
jgi:WD40 repeat protein